MRDLIVTENITLDGVIDASAGWFTPTGTEDPDGIAELTEFQTAQRASADGVLLGRVTYEQFAGYWPAQTDDETGVSEYLNTTEKYVVSATLTDPSWQHTTVLAGEPLAAIRALKDTDGGDIVATGSIQLVQALVGSGLVDEYRLFVFPVVLGAGARLFTAEVPGLRLVETHPFRTGIVHLRYRTD